MGTFQGHLLPGSLFIVFGTWWTSQIVRRSVMCNMQGRSFYTSVTYPCPMHGRCVSWPLEAAVKIILTLVGMALELIAATNYGMGGGLVFMGDLQHVTMYAFFCLSGVIDILQSYDKIPAGLDFVTLALAYIAEGLLFLWHLHGRNPLDTLLHTLLVYVIFACSVATLLELHWRNSKLAALVRAYLVLLQGTWFIQVGFILYHPIHGHWDSESEEAQLTATILFTWHFFGVFLCMAVVGALSRVLSRRICRPTTEDITYELLSDGDDDDNRFNTGGIQYKFDDEESDDPYSEIQPPLEMHPV